MRGVSAVLMLLLAGCAEPASTGMTGGPVAVSGGGVPSNQAAQACVAKADGKPDVYRECMRVTYASAPAAARAVAPSRQQSAANCIAAANGDVVAYRACIDRVYAGVSGTPSGPPASAAAEAQRKAAVARFEQGTSSALAAWLGCVRLRAASYAVASGESAEVIVRATRAACLGERNKWVEAARGVNPTVADNPFFLVMTENFMTDALVQVVLDVRAGKSRPSAPQPARSGTPGQDV